MDLPKNYNELSIQERKLVREEYVKLQDGLCHYCKSPLSGEPSDFVLNKWINVRLFPKSFFLWPIHLHHNHETGMTIGAVHNRCNAVLWQYENE
jgi:hypothetical protein